MSDEKPNVKRIFEGISNRMLVDFGLVQAQIKHAGERGRQRENALATFLSRYLPKKYALGSGHVIDGTSNISNQCDIVIYDAFNCPLLLVDDSYQLFPVESVLGVIEVKSVLNTRALAESVGNIQSVRKLKREEPVAGIVFGYRSGYTREPKIVTLAYALKKANTSIPPRERLDLLCVLSDGLIWEYKGESNNWGEAESALVACLEAEPTTFLLFLSWLIDRLEERKSSMPSLGDYATGYMPSIGGRAVGGAIGTCRLISFQKWCFARRSCLTNKGAILRLSAQYRRNWLAGRLTMSEPTAVSGLYTEQVPREILLWHSAQMSRGVLCGFDSAQSLVGRLIRSWNSKCAIETGASKCLSHSFSR